MINLKQLNFSFGSREVLRQLDLTIGTGEIIAVLGASGSGKSTLLNICAGLLRPSSGEITSDSGNQPSTALVFQDYALFPNLSVAENLSFVSTDNQAISEWTQRLKLNSELDKNPNQLSGGQKQRVAVARAMLCQPDLLLMDEPFSNLDTAHRATLRISLRGILKEQNQSTLMVTHDLEDAFSLADKIAVLERGKIIQVASPFELYHRPINEEIMKLSGAVTQIQLNGKKYFSRPEKLKLGESENSMDVEVTGCQFSGVFYKVFYRQAELQGYFYHPHIIENGTISLGIKKEHLLKF